jgi:hypothetical protein
MKIFWLDNPNLLVCHSLYLVMGPPVRGSKWGKIDAAPDDPTGHA